MVYPLFPGRTTDGTVYEGNQQYAGSGIVRYCPLCGKHRATGGGKIRLVMGLRQWTCKEHTK